MHWSLPAKKILPLKNLNTTPSYPSGCVGFISHSKEHSLIIKRLIIILITFAQPWSTKKSLADTADVVLTKYEEMFNYFLIGSSTRAEETRTQDLPSSCCFTQRSPDPWFPWCSLVDKSETSGLQDDCCDFRIDLDSWN